MANFAPDRRFPFPHSRLHLPPKQPGPHPYVMPHQPDRARVQFIVWFDGKKKEEKRGVSEFCAFLGRAQRRGHCCCSCWRSSRGPLKCKSKLPIWETQIQIQIQIKIKTFAIMATVCSTPLERRFFHTFFFFWFFAPLIWYPAVEYYKVYQLSLPGQCKCQAGPYIHMHSLMELEARQAVSKSYPFALMNQNLENNIYIELPIE